MVQQADGNYIYQANANYNGSDSLSYYVTDGELQSAERVIELTITPVNDAPILANQALVIAEDTALVINPLLSASDVDGDTLTAVITTQPKHGTLIQQADGSYLYQANANYHGSDSISYYVTDDELQSAERVIELTITPMTTANTAPVVGNSVIVGMEDTSYMFSWSDFTMTDLESDTLNLRITQLPILGTLQQQLSDGNWSMVEINDKFSRDDIELGKLRFSPLKDQSGGAGYTKSGYGNQHQHYAAIGFIANDGQLDSKAGTININIEAIADTPAINATSQSATSTLFFTSFEGVSNTDLSSTLLAQDMLDGWQLIKEKRSYWDKWRNIFGSKNLPFGGNGIDGFEIWHSKDQMVDNSNIERSVSASSNNGISVANTSWLELNDATKNQSQTLGIERDVQTKQGASYQLSFDYAGRNGFSDRYNGISIYLGDELLRRYSATSPAQALDWHNIDISFIGTGKVEKLRIVADSEINHRFGRGAMIDNIQLTESKANNQGLEDNLITLDTISAILNDNDGSEVLSLAIIELPLGTQLTDGKYYHNVTASDPTIDISNWQLDNLQLTTANGFSGQLTINVVATSTEVSSGSTATAILPLTIQVAAVADTPIITVGDPDMTTRQLIFTDFENSRHWNKDINRKADKYDQRWYNGKIVEDDVWRGVIAKAGKTTSFTLLNDGDEIVTNSGSTVNLNALSQSKRWLMLHDGMAVSDKDNQQLLGITSRITTIANMVYTVSFDYAAMLELNHEELSRIDIYAEDVLIASHQGSSHDNLDWTHLSYDFVGTGSKTTIKVLLGGVASGDKAVKGRTVMLDNLSIVETLPARINKEDAYIYALAGLTTRLPKISLSSSDKDGSEKYKLQVTGIPYGVTISDGVNSVTNKSYSLSTVDVTEFDLSQLTIRTPKYFYGDLKLSLIAKSYEADNSNHAQSRYDLNMTVLSGQPAVMKSQYITQFSELSIQQSTWSTSEYSDGTSATQPTLSASQFKESPYSNSPVLTTDSNSIDLNVSATQLIRDGENEATDKWLANMEATALQKW